MIVDDVITTGGSSLQAATAVKDFGATVVQAIAIVDRGATDNFRKAGIPYFAFFAEKDLSKMSLSRDARTILAVDLDYFYAQCEEIRKPEIKDKPVVICVFSGRTEDSGAVSTSNYVARKLGRKVRNPHNSRKENPVEKS